MAETKKTKTATAAKKAVKPVAKGAKQVGKTAQKAVAKVAEAALHYDKTAVEQEYSQTYKVMYKVLIIFLGIVLAYFVVLALILGHGGHTKHRPFYEQFHERFTIEYDGQKLPIYGEEGK